MAFCRDCGDEYSDKRKELGYDTCLSCGAEEAREIFEKMKKQTGVAYNKGPYMYLTSKKMVTDLGKK